MPAKHMRPSVRVGALAPVLRCARHAARHAMPQDGLVLIVALVSITMAVAILGTVFIRVVGHTHHVDRFITYKKALAGLESALAQSRAELEAGKDGCIGLDEWLKTYEDGKDVPDFETTGVTPVSLPSMPDVSYFALSRPWTDTGQADLYCVLALAKSGGSIRGAELVLRCLRVEANGKRVLDQVSWRELALRGGRIVREASPDTR